MMNNLQASHLAELLHLLRRDWDLPGVRAALAKADRMGTPPEVAIAAIRCAANRAARSPGIIPADGGHWRDTLRAGQPQTVRPERTKCEHQSAYLDCDECNRPIDPEITSRGAASAREALRQAPGYQAPIPRHDPQPADLSGARARADKETRS